MNKSYVINRQEVYIPEHEWETEEERRERLQSEKRQALILEQAQQEVKGKKKCIQCTACDVD